MLDAQLGLPSESLMKSTRTPQTEPVGAAIEDRMVWRGIMAAFLQDDSRLIDLEGAFRSSKTTACLRKVAKSCLRHPGIHWWLNRYSDGDTQRQLKPQWILMMQRSEEHTSELQSRQYLVCRL